MSNKRDAILDIFIEESTEIIDTLEAEIINLEESPWDKSILNEIFRGVHTLKGNANSFGFTKLGGFVHHLEDLLDFYREPNNQLDDQSTQLIFDAYDVIKEVFIYEKDGIDKYPDNYDSLLNQIKKSLNPQDDTIGLESSNKSLAEVVSKQHYHHSKFDTKEINLIDDEMKQNLLESCSDGKKIYNITMEFDKDLYLRGYNHLLFFRLFAVLGEVVRSFWYMDDSLPDFKDFDCEDSYIAKISVYIVSDCLMEDMEDVFEFIADDDEVGISIVDCGLLQINDGNVLDEEKKVLETQSSVDLSDNEIVQEPQVQTKALEVAKSIRVESLKLDELFDSIGELVIAQSYIDQNEQIRNLNNLEINQYLSMLNKTTRLIQGKVMNLRMVPIRDTFLKMKRVARDVSKKTNKEIELILSGEETEIDKTMVDSLSEPLIHIIRNSIDHGIEKLSEDRVSNGKDPVGKIYLEAMHKGSNFIIEVRDDGAGIDTNKILQKAIKNGIASSDIEYSKDEILQFLFEAGFSTAESITDVSGRGVGLDVVKKSLEQIKGKIHVESTVGVGSTFKMILPLTLAIIDGMTVDVENETFIVPTLSVVESFRAKNNEIQKAKGKGEFINFRGEVLPVIKLNKLLRLGDTDLNAEDSTLICIEHEKGRYVLQVNELLGRQQVVIKSLSKRLGDVKEISGAAIMGNGDIALILNTEGIRDWLDSNELLEASA